MKFFNKKSIIKKIGFVLAAAMLFAGCGGSSSSGGEEEEPPVVSVKLSEQNVTILQGSSITLTATVENTTNSAKWTKENTGIISWSKGLTGYTVTAVAAGEETITVTVKDDDGNEYTDTCKVTVLAKDENKSYITAITVSGAETVDVNTDSTFTADITFDDSSKTPANSSLTWYSSNEAVLKFEGDTATGVKAGSVTVWAVANDGSLVKSNVINVTVGVPATGLTVSAASAKVGYNKKTTLTATVTPTNCTYPVKWSIISGSDSGNLLSTSGKSVTFCGANATGSDKSVVIEGRIGTIAKTVEIIVEKNPSITTELLLSSSSVVLVNVEGKKTATLSAAVTNAENTNVSWSSSKTSVVTVADGVLTASGEGTAIITATAAADSSVTATCQVTVLSGVLESGHILTFASRSKVDADDYFIVEGQYYQADDLWKMNSQGLVTFTTTQANAEVTIYAITTSSTNWGIYSSTNSLVASGSISASTVESWNDLPAITPQTTTLAAAGTYTFKRPSGNQEFALQKLVVEEGTAPEVVYPTSIAISDSSKSVDLSTGTNISLTATVLPETVSSGYDAVVWSSSNPEVATVSASGTVMPNKAGTTTITVSTVNGKSAACEVTVTGSAFIADLEVVPGAKVTTYGWADRANSGDGMSYPSTENIIFIGNSGYKTGNGELTPYTSISKLTAFTNAIKSGSVNSSSTTEDAAIIVLEGTVDLSNGAISESDKTAADKFDSSTGYRLYQDKTFEVGGNRTIIGVNSAKIAYGGLILRRSNVIIRNVEFWDAHGSTEKDTKITAYSSSKASIDALVIEGNAGVVNNVWVDHCKFSDGTCNDLSRNYNHDGSFDIKSGKNVTVSYCEFTNHDKVMLVAPGDTVTGQEDRQITLHHNYFHNATQRMPRSRGCQMHVYNNYYNVIGQNSLGPGIGSMYIVENNYFGEHTGTIVKYFDKTSSNTDSTFSKFYYSGNYPSTLSCSYDSVHNSDYKFAAHVVTTKPWDIRYEYEMDNAADVKQIVPESAGVEVDGICKSVKVNKVVYAR